MNVDGIFSGMTISGSGMHAQTARMEVIAQNIANSKVLATTPGGDPYRRKDVVFETVLDENAPDGALEGSVRLGETRTDFETPLEENYDPKHPLADPATGIVKYPNVNTVFEMIDLMSASRNYEANLKAMGTWKEMVRQSLRLLEA